MGTNRKFMVRLATALVSSVLTMTISGIAYAAPMRQDGYHNGVAGHIGWSYQDGLGIENVTVYYHNRDTKNSHTLFFSCVLTEGMGTPKQVKIGPNSKGNTGALTACSSVSNFKEIN
jgi:hypothetical protein